MLPLFYMIAEVVKRVTQRKQKKRQNHRHGGSRVAVVAVWRHSGRHIHLSIHPIGRLEEEQMRRKGDRNIPRFEGSFPQQNIFIPTSNDNTIYYVEMTFMVLIQWLQWKPKPRNCHQRFSDQGSHHLRDPRTHKWWDCWNEEFHSLLLTFVHFCPLVCGSHKWRNGALVCILPLYVLTTVNVILLTILPDCTLSTKYIYIYIYIMLFALNKWSGLRPILVLRWIDNSESVWCLMRSQLMTG